MLSYNNFIQKAEMINEKLIVVGKGKPYGQVVFLAGGAGSGKGFASKNFMEYNKFKVRDVDEWKKAFMKISELKGKYTDQDGNKLSSLDLRNPKDVSALHVAVRDMNIKNKTLDLLLKNAKTGRLPNIMFDITLKDIDDISKVLPSLKEVGFQSTDIHIVWVLASYHVAVAANRDRERVVDDKILFKTHVGAANTMYDIIKSKGVSGVDGSVHVILNNRENTIFFQRPDGTKTKVIKDFKYLTLKKEGKPFYSQGEVNGQIRDWILDNIPKTGATKHMWG